MKVLSLFIVVPNPFDLLSSAENIFWVKKKKKKKKKKLWGIKQH